MIETFNLNLINFMLWVMLAYIPVLWYLDIRYREVDYHIWIPMVMIGLPVTAYFYATDIYPWYSFVISIVMIAIFYTIMRFDKIQGADFIYLSAISLFWVINPIPWTHGLMQIVFYIYLIVVMLITAGVLLIRNIIVGHRFGLIEMMSYYPRGVPMLIPISIAFILTVMFG